MKKTLMISLAAVMIAATCANLSAQQRRGNGQGREGAGQGRPDMAAMVEAQANRIADALELEQAVREQFVPLFSEYKTEAAKLYMNGSFKGRKEPQNDDEAETQILEGFARDRSMCELKEAYYARFREIMSPVLIRKMYQMENRGMMGHGGPQGGQGMRGGNGEGQPNHSNHAAGQQHGGYGQMQGRR